MDEIDEAIRHMVERSGKIKGTSSDVPEGEASEEAVADNFIVRNALSYIEEHYNEKILLSDVADKVYVSQWHLSKLLNKETGKNFSEILNTVRIKKASELLKDPSKRCCGGSRILGCGPFFEGFQEGKRHIRKRIQKSHKIVQK